MADYPNDFNDGDELPASAVNQILAARTGDIKPIDDTTRNYTNAAGSIGTSDVSFLDGFVDEDMEVGEVLTFGNTLGDWDTSTYAVDTVYQASNDMFICADVEVTNLNSFKIEGITDSNASPTQVIRTASAYTNSSGGNETYVPINGITFPVKKGDYWKVLKTLIAGGGTPTITINAIEIGA